MKSKSSTTTKEELLPLITPGDVLLDEFMTPLGLSANALSLKLRVPANRIQAIVKGERAITADTALRLARLFGNSPQFWMNLQTRYEIRKAQREAAGVIEQEVPVLTPRTA
jgi:addiction module HigA family antidote